MTATSFEKAYDEHVFRVYGFIAYRVTSREEAEDLTQQTFERALRAWGRFDAGRASMATWLLAIARNLIIDRHRADRPAVPIDDVDEARLPADPGDRDDLGVSDELTTALLRLSERDREIVALRYGADLAGPEIATVTGLTLANVQQILSRSLRRLRAELEPVSAPERAVAHSAHGGDGE